MRRPAPPLHRDDPDKDPLVGHVKVTQSDWLNAARDTLVSDGVASLKILTLSKRLGVSRSSFYWYFDGREDLLDSLLEDWEATNTARIIAHCARPTVTICEGVLNFFRCFIDPAQFDQGLDFAIREWSRRDAKVRKLIDKADAARIAAIRDLFWRNGYTPNEAEARARILYFQQIGYHALDLTEPLETRLNLIDSYVIGFTGRDVDPHAIAAFCAFAREVLGEAAKR